MKVPHLALMSEWILALVFPLPASFMVQGTTEAICRVEPPANVRAQRARSPMRRSDGSSSPVDAIHHLMLGCSQHHP
ncbi:hypothetical protein BO71DRAFT_428491 [Aspergillus ellipticus CBS 707.79]|uniref:Secreted protein n=1 Tax=Aspergillus ellipticus CBS 707.79 TaxID=1448320 RepID=A0A319DFB7_9EURO|nr:hypothetical protein BO71DRAFT_428491 [Aspergillus ellipticus CBS 707.79]